MTAAGIATMAICAEALHGPKAYLKIRQEKRVSMGQLRLGELLLAKGYKDEEIYAMYGVERGIQRLALVDHPRQNPANGRRCQIFDQVDELARIVHRGLHVGAVDREAVDLLREPQVREARALGPALAGRDQRARRRLRSAPEAQEIGDDQQRAQPDDEP